MVAVFGRRQHQFGLGDVAGVEVQRSRFGVPAEGGVLLFPAIGLLLPVGQSSRIDETVEGDEGLEQVVPHGRGVIATGLEGDRHGALPRRAPGLLDHFDGPVARRVVPRDQGAEADDRFDKPQSKTALPPDERSVMKWNGNPYALDTGSGGNREEAGTYWLLPYWMGRYYGFIIEE